jgi:hypothetical protein
MDALKEGKASKATTMMALRVACNLFKSKETYEVALSVQNASYQNTPHRSVLTAFLIESLLSEHVEVRRNAASLAYNMAITPRISSDNDEDLELREEWCSEILIAISNVVEKEEEAEAGRS